MEISFLVLCNLAKPLRVAKGKLDGHNFHPLSNLYVRYMNNWPVCLCKYGCRSSFIAAFRPWQ